MSSHLRRLVPSLSLLAFLPVTGAGAAALALPAAPASAAPSCSGTVLSYSLTATAGTPQSTKVGTAFATPLQVEVLADTAAGSCPAAGIAVEFGAPSSGPSATFNGGGDAATVITGSDGTATAPTLYANNLTGTYTVVASTSGTASEAGFDLTNTTVGVVASVTVSSGSGQSAKVGATFALPLVVEVSDTFGDPVAGASVSFAVVTTNGAGASFVGGGSSAAVQTDETGTASSPLLVAGSTAGAFTVTATVSGATSPATFSLTDLAATPSSIVAGSASSQEAQLGTDFAVPLAVTVTDTNSNAVPGAKVTFSAPHNGPSGVFAGSGATVTVITDSSGVATAPKFSADQVGGGYIVMARVAGVATPATFALVNVGRSGASAPGLVGTYWLATAAGQVLTSGGAVNYGSAKAIATAAKVVGIAATADRRGYWLVTSTGAVSAFGDAASLGSVTGHLAKPIVGIAATPDAKGYWLVASDGGVFSFGDARFRGAVGTTQLKGPIVGIATTSDGKGYWLVASNGEVFAFGDAHSYGSVGAKQLRGTIVGIAATPDGTGYWLVASDGGVSRSGTPPSTGRQRASRPCPSRRSSRPPTAPATGS